LTPGRRQKIADIRLKAHPESFQVEPQGGRVFVNVPDANEIAVLDLATAKQTITWPTKNLRANFPLRSMPNVSRSWSCFGIRRSLPPSTFATVE